MQAAFRAQNPWSYDIDGKQYRKLNAYVFDFAPERTLVIYDEFANNLNRQTAGGGGTTDDREGNIRKLLNFFPVIAEDAEGRMVELDVRQVLTIPKAIKAQEVVRRGFMSNLLFQNISGLFASQEAREILENLNPVAPGKATPSQSSVPLDTQNVTVDESGKAVVPREIVVAETEARFGEKVYEVTQVAAQSDIAAVFTNAILDSAKDLAKENSVTCAQAEQAVRQNANVLAREVEVLQKKAEIQQKEAENEYKREVAAAQNDDRAVAEADARYEEVQKKIAEDLKAKLTETVTDKARELTQKTTENILQKSVEKKKAVVEDDIRTRLRGFARTIPSFLMAYGTPATTLANFDLHIKDAVFTEVTGITLDQFRALRDKYKFFDSVVFNQSIQEFLHKKEELANYLGWHEVPGCPGSPNNLPLQNADETSATPEEDIFDYIPPQRTNQIFTPKRVVRLMLDKMEEEDPDLFTDPDRTFADLYVKSGLYLTEIVKRLFVGLETAFPDAQERLKHILEHQIYGFAPTEIIYNIARNFIFGGFPDINDSHLQCRDLAQAAKKGEVLEMKFSVVVGNPPYQESGEARDEPVYHYFYDLAEQISKEYCLISPARFLFNAGQTPKPWNAKMLEDTHLKVVFYEQNSASVFANTDIKGGVAILYRNKAQVFGKIGVFTHHSELNSIVGKVAALREDDFSTIVQPQGIYRFSEQFFEDFPQAEEMQGKGTKNKIVSRSFSQMDFAFHAEKSAPDEIQMLGLVNGKREYKWISSRYLVLPSSFDKYRTIIAETNNTGVLGETLSSPLIGIPGVAHTDTFLTVGAFDTESEAVVVLNYIKTKFARVLLGILKITQHNSRATWAKVPLQDFTPQSDIDWTQSIPDIDRQLYAKYGLDEHEIAFIEEKVRPME